MAMHLWQALLLLRSQSRDKTCASPHVQSADLERFVLGAIEAAESKRIAEHTERCTACRLRLKDARDFSRLLARLPNSPERSSIGERRRDPRYQIAEPAAITVCNPFDRIEMRAMVVDVSKCGCRIQTSKPIYFGADVFVLVSKAAIFGTVRHCREDAAGLFDIGLRIDQLVMRPSSNTALDFLKAANGKAREVLATPSMVLMHPAGRWPCRLD
jgi:hypothetical protein